MDKIFYEFDPEEESGIRIPRDKLSEVKERVADFVLEETLSYVGRASSPVEGHGKFQGLSKGYKKIKGEFSSSVKPNLELTGDMLDDLEVVEARGSRLRLQIEGAEADKADGHCRHSGRTPPKGLPQRTFIPDGKKGEKFHSNIRRGIKDIVKSIVDED